MIPRKTLNGVLRLLVFSYISLFMFLWVIVDG